MRQYELDAGVETSADVPTGNGAEIAGQVVVKGGEIKAEGIKIAS